MKLYEHHVEKRLGRGGFGSVDLVIMTNGPLKGKKLALKTIQAKDITEGMTDKEKQMAVNEAKTLRTMKNLHIVRFHHAWWEKEDVFKILLELCEDGTLKEAINSQRGKHFDNLQITDWSTQLALAIKYLHNRKIIHRDIKPQNIFLCRGKELLKLGDFGLLKLFQTTAGYTNARAGTANYMSPEVHKGENYNYPADVWAFACVLFELTNLKMAYTAQNEMQYAVILKIIQNDYQKFERDFCKDLILKCFQGDQKARPTIGQVLEALNEVQKELEQVQQHFETPGNFENLTVTEKSTSMSRGDGSEMMTSDLGTSLSEEKTRKHAQVFSCSNAVSSETSGFQTSTSLSRGDGSGVMTSDLGTSLSEENTSKHANVLSCSNSDLSAIFNFQTSASCLYEHRGSYPRLLWANIDYFCSFGWFAKDAFLCDLTSDSHSKTEIGKTVCATLRSDGKIVTGNQIGEVYIWSNNRKLLSQKIYDEPVREMCSLSDERVFTASLNGTVKVLGPKLDTINTMEGPKNATWAIGNYEDKVTTGDGAGIIRYYDLNEESQTKTLNGHSSSVSSVSLQKKLIASGSVDTTVALWKPTESDQPVFVMKHDDWVRTVLFGREASSNKLYSCSEDKTTAIWNIETGKKLDSIKHPGEATCLDLHPDGHLAATGHDYGISLLDIRVPKIVKEIKGRPDGEENKTWKVKFSPNGKRIGFTECQGAVKILDLRS